MRKLFFSLPIHLGFFLSIIFFLMPVPASHAQSLDNIIEETKAGNPDASVNDPENKPSTFKGISDLPFYNPPPEETGHTLADIIREAICLSVPGAGIGNWLHALLAELIKKNPQLGNQPAGPASATPAITPPEPASLPAVLPGATSETEEAFLKRNASLIEGFKTDAQWQPNGKAPKTGDSDGSDIKSFDFPGWFCNVQLSLIQRKEKWGPEQEQARKLLEDYAAIKIKNQFGSPLPHNVAQFLTFMGYSKNSNPAAAEPLYKNGDNAGWCQSASFRAFYMPLAPKYRFEYYSPSQQKRVQSNPSEGSFYAWAKPPGYKVDTIARPGGFDVNKKDIQPGDGLLIKKIVKKKVGDTFEEVVMTHAVTCAGVKNGKILMISGNAGGGGGSVRLEELDPKTDMNKGWAIVEVRKTGSLSVDKLDKMTDEERSKIGIVRSPE